MAGMRKLRQALRQRLSGPHVRGAGRGQDSCSSAQQFHFAAAHLLMAATEVLCRQKACRLGIAILSSTMLVIMALLKINIRHQQDSPPLQAANSNQADAEDI